MGRFRFQDWSAACKPSGVPRPKPTTDPLVEWEDQPSQRRVLDWRRRARRYGLTPGAEESADVGDDDPDVPPEQLIADEEPEAAAPQVIDDGEEAEEVDDSVAEPSFAPATDLVARTLREVGRWPLLTPAQESRTRAADRRRTGRARWCPGRNAMRHRIRLRTWPTAFGPGRPRCGARAARGRRRTGDGARQSRAARHRPRRSAPVVVVPVHTRVRVTRLSMRARCTRAEKARRLIARALARQPIRPSLVEEIVAQLGSVDVPRDANRAARAAFEKRTSA